MEANSHVGPSGSQLIGPKDLLPKMLLRPNLYNRRPDQDNTHPGMNLRIPLLINSKLEDLVKWNRRTSRIHSPISNQQSTAVNLLVLSENWKITHHQSFVWRKWRRLHHLVFQLIKCLSWTKKLRVMKRRRISTMQDHRRLSISTTQVSPHWPIVLWLIISLKIPRIKTLVLENQLLKDKFNGKRISKWKTML